jgi:chorismate mutase
MATLDALRHDLDEIDDQFVALFARRQDTIRQIAAFKAGSTAPLRDELREAARSPG